MAKLGPMGVLKKYFEDGPECPGVSLDEIHDLGTPEFKSLAVECIQELGLVPDDNGKYEYPVS